MEGLRFKANLTEHDTQAIRGIGVWNAVHRGLADASVQHGWIRREYKNFAVIERPPGGLSIAVLAGSSSTGLAEPADDPQNSCPISPGQRVQTLKRIETNREIVDYRSHFSNVSAEWGPAPLTYFLVHRIDEYASEIRGELSLPTRVQDGYITGWRERIILSPQEGSASATPMVEDGPSTYGGEEPIVIPIVDKAL